jgi:hypothetical protein
MQALLLLYSALLLYSIPSDSERHQPCHTPCIMLIDGCSDSRQGGCPRIESHEIEDPERSGVLGGKIIGPLMTVGQASTGSANRRGGFVSPHSPFLPAETAIRPVVVAP